MTRQQARNAINDFYAKKLRCARDSFRKRGTTTIIQIAEEDRPECPFLAVDNGVAQVFSVTGDLRTPLEETLFWCTHWAQKKIDIHDYVFFNDMLWPKLREIAPLEHWYKGVLLYCIEEWHTVPFSGYKVSKMNRKQRLTREKGAWPEETYCICEQSTEPDFHGNLRKISGPASFASVRRHQESDLVVSIEIGTKPEFRRKGMAKAVLAFATKKIIDSGRIPIYGTSPENFGSLATVHSVGYHKYGKILGFRHQ